MRSHSAEKARVSATKPSTGTVSARAVGSIPAAASSGSGSTPSDLRLWRSILRRWPKAACVTRCSVAAIAGEWLHARDKLDQRGRDLGRRHEGRRRDVEQDARLVRQPASTDRRP